MYLSLIRLRQDISPKDIASFGKFDGYQHHKIVWNLFSDSPDRKRDFLYRYEMVNDRPTFYVISDRPPEDIKGLWEINLKTYKPKLTPGERLAFKLRVNPIHHDKKERTESEIEAWRASRQERGLKEKEPTKKRIRHDVVMEEKSRIGFKHLPHDQRPHVATLIQDAGTTWLKDKEGEFGFLIGGNKENPQVRVDGYLQHKLYKGRGAKPVTFTTLDFDGTLTVTDPDVFVEKCLFNGIGPAKGFGCGLMLVRRI